MKLPVFYSKLNQKTRKRVREQYIEEQKNKCMFCNKSLAENPPDPIKNAKIDWSLFPTGFLKYPIHLQHNHDTDLTEGAVHSYCNAYMWQYEGR
jgi:hypothetical protein